MNDRQPESEPAAATATGPFTIQDGQLALRPDIDKLRYDVILESVECLAFLQENPNHAVHVRGTVLIGATLNPDEWVGLIDDPIIPRYAYNVCQWAVPNTPVYLTDLGADLVTSDETSKFPHVVDPLSFNNVAELEQILAGLRALRS